MDDLNKILAGNLKRVREERKLSMDKVAELTGVSKSMIGQIERGESNPTITTVWRIAKGLKLSFTSLINNPQPEAVVIRRSQVTPMIEDDGKYRVYPYFPFEEGRRFEVYYIEIDEGGYLDADPHTDGTEEYLTVFEGELTMRIGIDEYVIKAADALRIKADKPHMYHNSGKGTTRISMVIYYPTND